jgi:hypothetical protein
LNDVVELVHADLPLLVRPFHRRDRGSLEGKAGKG